MMFSFTHLVKAKSLSTVQKALPSLTPSGSYNLICWLPQFTHPELIPLHAPCSLHLFSLCLENSYSSFKIQFKTQFKSRKYFMISPGKHVVVLQFPLYYICLLHLVHFFLIGDHLLECLSFLQNTADS